MKKTTIIVLIIIFLALIGILIFSIFNLFQITGEVVKEINNYSFTKAVCNNSNYCEDYEVVCEGKDLVSFTPTGMAIQLPGGWEDPRDKDSIERLC
tara:strand:- start:271 stop:558 length:288 start_codon:yes stop_codon:yes gene_type:complete